MRYQLQDDMGGGRFVRTAPRKRSTLCQRALGKYFDCRVRADCLTPEVEQDDPGVDADYVNH
jgi:hypothetical protein